VKTPRSDGSSTPIVPPPSKLRGRKSTIGKFSNSQSSIRQVFDSFKRPGRKATMDSLEGASLGKDRDLEYNEAELHFLHWLDSEIEKIDKFYQEKENDAEERYKLLSAQLEALRQLRETHHLESNETSQSVSRAEPSDGHRASWVQKPINTVRASLDGLSSAMPAADHERRAKNPELIAHPISTSTGYVEYRIARRRLKEAILEFYRGMELLKGYRLLNRTGLVKILKKFDKTSGRKISGEYTEKLKSTHFDQSDSLENMMDHIEVGLFLWIS
jgi:xenotropic and polytropic retrovirus receptor 1